MINQAGIPQFPNNLLQPGIQQTGGNQQNQTDRRAETNRPQENRSAEASGTQNTNRNDTRNFQEIAESILARRNEGGDVTPAVSRGAIVDITV